MRENDIILFSGFLGGPKLTNRMRIIVTLGDFKRFYVLELGQIVDGVALYFVSSSWKIQNSKTLLTLGQSQTRVNPRLVLWQFWNGSEKEQGYEHVENCRR